MHSRIPMALRLARGWMTRTGACRTFAEKSPCGPPPTSTSKCNTDSKDPCTPGCVGPAELLAAAAAASRCPPKNKCGPPPSSICSPPPPTPNCSTPSKPQQCGPVVNPQCHASATPTPACTPYKKDPCGLKKPPCPPQSPPSGCGSYAKHGRCQGSNLENPVCGHAPKSQVVDCPDRNGPQPHKR